MTKTTPIPPNLARLRRKLRAISSRVRALMVLRALLLTAAIVGGSGLVLAVGDYLLRLPASLRLALLAGLVGLLVYLLWSRVRPAMRSRLRETEVALIIERHNPACRGLLASAIDLSDQQPGDDEIARDLREGAIRKADERLAQSTLPTLLRYRVLARPGIWLGGVSLVLVLIASLQPAMFGAGLQRILTPWGDARWPVRFAIWDVTEREPRAVDSAVPLRALVGSSESDLGSPARTMVSWRLLDAGGDPIGAWARTLLMPQRRRDAQRDIPVYEQLIDPREPAARRPEDQRFTLEYRISTRDDRTPTRRIELVRPPRLAATKIEITLPEYAASLSTAGVVEAGLFAPETGESTIAPVLRGSRVSVLWSFSKPIGDDPAPPEWIERVLAGASVESYTRPDDRSVELVFDAREPILIEPVIYDRSGVPVREPIALAVDVIEDLAPSVRLVDPPRDERMTARAIIPVTSELGDDLGLTRAGLWGQRSTPPRGSSGAPPEPIGEPTEIVSLQLDELPLRARASATLELEGLGLAPGDELHLWADAYDLRWRTPRPSLGYARSGVRVLRIVTEEELIDRVRQALDPLRGNLRALDERQGEVQGLLRDASPRAGDEQRALTERLRANRDALGQLASTIQRNAIDDEALRSTLEDGAAVLDEATAQSERGDDQIRRGETEDAQRSQQQVRDRLGDLLSMLDQGQDAWMALRDVQQLRDQLESIRGQTQELSQRTAGQSLSEMSEEDRGALERILERQTENAEDARDAINQLDQRADELQESDPTQSEALRRAAQQARAAQIEQQLRQAGAQIEQNQTSSAARTQEEVLEELEELLEELENTVQNRDNALRRELASIIESLGRLIDAQEREIIRLDEMVLGGDLSGMDARLIALVRNTLSVRDDALGAFPETRSIADHITRAGTAQSGAINALRSQPPNADSAQDGQRAALTHLRNALEEARRLDDEAAQREAERAREALREAYAEALDTQTRIHEETLALGMDDLTRRERARARALGGEQRELGEALSAMLGEHEGLSDAPIFSLAHEQLGRLMAQSAEGLEERRVTQRARASQRRAMAVLASLIDVLGEQQQQQEDFEDAQGQGQQGGGQQSGGDQPLIPPVAELRLLRSMQELVMEQTRSLGEADAPDPDEVRGVGELQRRLYEQGAALIESMNPSPPGGGPTGGASDPGNPEPIEPVETEEP